MPSWSLLFATSPRVTGMSIRRSVRAWSQRDYGNRVGVFRLMEMLDDQDDVQNVWTNFDIPEEMMET